MRSSFLAILLLPALAVSQPKFSHPDRIRFDGHCFTIDGNDTFVFSGAFHYFRCPEALWPERFRRIKEAGFNAVETYVPWNWSEREKPSGLNDYSKMNLKELDEFLTMAEDQFGLYTIVRPGPYICSEWATGGYPNWLPSFEPKGVKRGTWFRGDEPVFEAWSKHWFDAVAKVVDKHQLTHKPIGAYGVILWQVENEYDYSGISDDIRSNYLRYLINVTKGDGIDVPIFTCWTSPVRYPKGDPILSEAFDNSNEYPRWNIGDMVRDLSSLHKAQPWSPKMITEFQGGWFGQVGGKAAEEQAGIDSKQINALTLSGIANGLTALNYYMLFGGTNFGDWAGQNITTSYDYFAPIREWGGVGDKYRAVQAIGRMLAQYGPDIARSDLVPNPLASDSPKVQVLTRKGPQATYVFVRNLDRQSAVSGKLGRVVSYDMSPADMGVYRFTDDPANGHWVVNPALAPTLTTLPNPVRIDQAETASLSPEGWRDTHDKPSTLELGVWDSRFIYYRAHVPEGGTRYLWLQTKGDLAGADAPDSENVDGGQLSSISGGDKNWLYLNTGWPNGGGQMELPHGILNAQVFAEKPQGAEVSGWKVRTLSDPADRSLVGTNVDTTGWDNPPAYNDFPENTTMVYRAGFDLPEEPKADLSLSIGGVDDEGWFYVNGVAVGDVHQYDVPFAAKVGKLVHLGHNEIAMVIHNVGGPGGLTGAVRIESPLPPSAKFALEWTDKMKAGIYSNYGLDKTEDLPIYTHPDLSGGKVGDQLVRSRLRFAKPTEGAGWAWEIVIDAGGDGFLTLNGQPLGRYWEQGPQRAYFLPSNMLKDQNVLELTARPGHLGDKIKAAELRPLPMDY